MAWHGMSLMWRRSSLCSIITINMVSHSMNRCVVLSIEIISQLSYRCLVGGFFSPSFFLFLWFFSILWWWWWWCLFVLLGGISRKIGGERRVGNWEWVPVDGFEKAHVYACVCTCAYACERKRERKGEREGEREREKRAVNTAILMHSYPFYSISQSIGCLHKPAWLPAPAPATSLRQFARFWSHADLDRRHPSYKFPAYSCSFALFCSKSS